MTSKYCLIAASLAVFAAQTVGCSSEFTSCITSRTCPRTGGAGGEAGDSSSSAGATQSGRGGADDGGQAGAGGEAGDVVAGLAGAAGAGADGGDAAGTAGQPVGQGGSSGMGGLGATAGTNSVAGGSGVGGGPVGSIAVDTPVLGVGKTFAPYSATITANGASNYTWSLQSGALPAGVSLLDTTKAAARIAGTPTEAGLFPIVLSVTDGTRTGSFKATLSVTHPVAFRADRRVAGTQELFLTEVGAETPASPVRLTPALFAPGVTDYAWSPDATKILYQITPTGGPAELWVVSVASPGVATRVTLANEVLASYTWLRAGAVVAYATAAGDVNLVDLSGAMPGVHQSVSLPTLAGFDVRTHNIAPSPDGKSLIVERKHNNTVAAAQGRVTVTYVTWNGSALTGRVDLIPPDRFDGYGFGDDEFSYDGRFVLRRNIFQGIGVWDLSSNATTPSPLAPFPYGAAWSPTAETLLYQNDPQSGSAAVLTRQTYAGGVGATAMLSRAGDCSPYTPPGWSPDGNSAVVTCGVDLRVFSDVATAVLGADRSVLPNGFLLNAFTDIRMRGWSPDSHWLALTADRDVSTLYDLFLIRPTAVTPVAYRPYASSVNSISNWWFSPNSKSVAILGTLVPQAQPSLYLSTLPINGAPSNAVLVSDGSSAVQGDVTWLPGSRVILNRATVTGGAQLFASSVTPDGSVSAPQSVSGQSGAGVTSYQIAPIR